MRTAIFALAALTCVACTLDTQTATSNVPSPGNGNQVADCNALGTCPSNTNTNTNDSNGVAAWSLPSPSSGNPNDAGAYTGGSIYTFYGRVSPGATNPTAQQTLSWSQSGIGARFTHSTTVTINQGPPPGGARTYLYVAVDGRPAQIIDSLNPITTLRGLDYNQIHTISVIKRNETGLGIALLNGLTLDANGYFLSPPPLSQRRIEVLGDSISCGYGEVNAPPYCYNTVETEDSTVAYGSLTASILDADIHLISWSGTGMYSGYTGPPMVNTLPELWLQTIPTLSNGVPSWDFNTWSPQVVVVNLGTNDFAWGDPGNANYTGAYASLISQVRTYYGADTYIFACVSSMVTGGNLSTLRAYVDQVVTTANNNGDDRVFAVDFSLASTVDNSGCGGHPSVAAHRSMAAALSAAIQPYLPSGNHTVGGYASGMNGNVVIANGGNTLATLSAEGPFTLPGNLAAGQGYDIGVLQDPPGQTCHVLNGRGAVGVGNVNNVYVLCANQITITGHVRAIVNTLGPVYLQNADNNDLVVSPNGTFQFFAPVAPEGNYNIVLGQAPLHNTCSINGNGTRFTDAVNASAATVLDVNCWVTPYSVTVAVSGLPTDANVTLGNLTTNNLYGPTVSENDALVATSNTSYTFEKGIPYGGSYNVSVSSSTPGLTCSTLNASGTVGGNVTDVLVVCSGNDAVGGVVSGLQAGNGMILTNGPDVVTIGANGNFTFPSSVTVGATIAPSVQLQPHGQSCTMTVPGGGVAGNGNVSLTISCSNNAAGTYAVGGSVTGLVAQTRLVLQNGSNTIYSSNGNFSFKTPITNAGNYNVTQMTPPGQKCVISNSNGTISGAAVTNVAVNCTPFFQFTNGQAANVVLGQPDFFSSAAPSAFSAASIYEPFGHTYTSPTGAVYFAQSAGSRVIGYKALPTTNNAPGDFVVGQATFSSAYADTTAVYSSSPQSFAGIGNTVVLADSGGNRVVVYHMPPQGLASADVVIGQATFTASSSGCSQNTMSGPRDVALGANGLLAVADVLNHRVLIYHTLPTVNGANADVVLGQPDFTTSNANTTVTANTLNTPSGVWTDGNRLAIADTLNNRVLLFNNILLAVNGQNADVVVGHTDMNIHDASGGATGLSLPFSVTSEGSHLIVADSGYSRVLMYDGWPASNSPAATTVLGHTVFTTGGAETGASGMNYAAGVSVSGTSLLVADYAYNRYLIFNSN